MSTLNPSGTHVQWLGARDALFKLYPCCSMAGETRIDDWLAQSRRLCAVATVSSIFRGGRFCSCWPGFLRTDPSVATPPPFIPTPNLAFWSTRSNGKAAKAMQVRSTPYFTYVKRSA